MKFSTRETTVTLDVKETDREILMQISDEGIGIPPEDLPHIFDTFYRGHGHKKHTGYGLGLAAVNKIVKAHGGRVLVSSEVGKGNGFFTVALPKKNDEEDRG